MAPLHTMKYKEETEVPVMMNPPLSAIINGAKAGSGMGEQSTKAKNVGGDNLKSIDQMAGSLKSNIDTIKDEKKGINLKVSKVMNTRTENAKPITDFLEKETNVSVDKKGVAVTKAQDFWSSPQEHLPSLKRKDTHKENGENQRPIIETKESKSVIDLSRKVEAMKLDILGTLDQTPRPSRQSSTTLTPGLEAMLLTSTPKTSTPIAQSPNSTVLANGIKNITLPTTPTKKSTTSATHRTPEQKRSTVSSNFQSKMRSPKTSPKLSPQATTRTVIFDNSTLKGKSGDAKQVIDKSISEIEFACYSLAGSGSDSEGGWTDTDTENVMNLLDANRGLVKGVALMGWEDGEEVVKAIITKGVKEIEGLLGEWEREHPDGAWDDVVVRLGNVDEKVVAEWKALRARFRAKEKSGGEKKDDDAIGESGGEADVESDDSKYDGDASEGSGGSKDSGDEGNESMEYIAPAEIIAKKAEKQNVVATLGTDGALKAPGLTPTSVLTTPLPSQIFDFNFAPTSTVTKSPRSTSPIRATPSPVKSMPVATLPSKAFDFGFTPANTAPLAQPSKTLQSPPLKFNFTPAATSVTPALKLHSHLPANGSGKQGTTPQVVSEQGLPGSSSKTASQPIFNFNPASLTTTPPQISTPPFTPNLSSDSFTTSSINSRDSKTPPTLATLTQTSQSIQTTLQTLHSAVYGLNPSPVPQSAKDAGLLLISNYIGERVTNIQTQTSTLDTKINEIGRLVQNQDQTFEKFKAEEQEVVRAIQETSTRAYIAALSAESKAQQNSEVLAEIKSFLLKNEKQMQEQRENQQRISTLLNENLALKQESAKQQKGSDGQEDIILLRAEHKELNKEVKRLTKKLEMYVEYRRGVEGWGEESDPLMEVLWPQGWESVVPGERGVLADEPGFGRDEKMGNQAGRKGPSGGWCSVM